MQRPEPARVAERYARRRLRCTPGTVCCGPPGRLGGPVQARKGLVTHRTKALWVPCLVTLILSIFANFEIRDVIGWQGARDVGPVCLFFSLPRLLAHAFIGGIGAYWSCRAGGSSRHRLLAALTPALWQTGAVVEVVTKGAVVGRLASWAVITSALLDRAVIPGVALLVGALPFLWMGRRRAATRDG
jgi:hypothetical protein